MDKIETPEEFADRVAIDYKSGPYSLRKVLMDNTSGRDALLRADERRKAAGWISVKERLPEENKLVLVHSKRGWIGVAQRLLDEDEGGGAYIWEDEHTEFVNEAWLTHWVPLPEPPAIMAEPEEAHS